MEAIYWKPQMCWVIDRLHVLKPIRFTNVRRNEISCKIPVKGSSGVNAAMKNGAGTLGVLVSEVRQQRAAMVLRDVCYGIEAHVEVLDPEGSNGESLRAPEAKHLEMFKRRAARGQYFHHPYLGCREFPADFELVEQFPAAPEELHGPKELGYMLHDIAFLPAKKGPIVDSNRGRRLEAQPRFFRATLQDGVLEVPPFERALA